MSQATPLAGGVVVVRRIKAIHASIACRLRRFRRTGR